MIYVRVDRDAGFKRCCMLTGRYDGVERDYFFSRVTLHRRHGFAKAGRVCLAGLAGLELSKPLYNVISMTFRAIDHAQLAMPLGREGEARFFYGEILGLEEVPKPPNLAKRGGVWFRSRDVSVHLGIDTNFHPATKAHPAFVCEKYDALLRRLRQHNVEIISDEQLIDERAHCYVSDPFGNRLEIIEG
jgi:Glyoxalase/Bleomycin resistance protein/Dioxygenase superfamily